MRRRKLFSKGIQRRNRNRLSPEARSRIGGVPWQDMIGMRNVLIHGYDAVDLAIVWDTAARRVPGLIEALERHVEAGDPG